MSILPHLPPIIEKRSLNKHLLCRKEYYTKEFRDLLSNIDYYIEHSKKKFKNQSGDTTTVVLSQVNNKQIIIKRYNVKSMAHRLKNWLRPSKAIKAWKNAAMLNKAAVATISPIAILEKRYWFLKNESYLIMEYIKGDLANEYFAANKQKTAEWEQVWQSLKNNLINLEKAKIQHKDLHAGNILISANKAILLDIEHARKIRSRKKLQKAHKKDIKHITKFFDLHPWIKERLKVTN